MDFRYLSFLVILVFPGVISYCQPDSSSTFQEVMIIRNYSCPVNFIGIPDAQALNARNQIKLLIHSAVFGNGPAEDLDNRITFHDKNFHVDTGDEAMMKPVSFRRDFMRMGSELNVLIINKKESRFHIGARNKAVSNVPLDPFSENL